MPSFADDQARFVACLQNGPAHFPADLFAESRERALLGLRTHASTISHARLVALENAYPRLHLHSGHDRFHALSRAYTAQEPVWACDLNGIASGFAAFLQSRAASATEIDLARVEWAWMESYGAAEAPPVTLADLAALDQHGLLALPIAPHPALRRIVLTGEPSPQLPALVEDSAVALMITRPEATIKFHPLSAIGSAIAARIAGSNTLGALLEYALEQTDEASAMPHLTALVGAGALTCPARDQGR